MKDVILLMVHHQSCLDRYSITLFSNNTGNPQNREINRIKLNLKLSDDENLINIPSQFIKQLNFPKCKMLEKFVTSIPFQITDVDIKAAGFFKIVST